MNCTVTIALENFSLAAADTRLNLLENDTWTRMDARVGGFTLNSGEWLEIPNYYRKIRKINHGWAASTGDFVTAQIVLKALQSLSWNDATLFDLWVGARHGIRAASQLGSGFSLDEIDKTQIIIAAPNPACTVQVLQLGDSAIAQSPAYFCTMPPGVTQAQFDEMIGGIQASFKEAIESKNLARKLRCALRVIQLASERCETVGPLVHMGFTIVDPSSNEQHCRLDGNAVELLSLSEPELLDRVRDYAEW